MNTLNELHLAALRTLIAQVFPDYTVWVEGDAYSPSIMDNTIKIYPSLTTISLYNRSTPRDAKQRLQSIMLMRKLGLTLTNVGYRAGCATFRMNGAQLASSV